MATYMLVEITVEDPELYAEYVERVPATVLQYGGRYLIRGGRITTLSGGWNPDRVILVEFPSDEALYRWAQSAEYLALAPLRERSTRTRAIALEGYT